MKSNRSAPGFTLIELLVTIVITAILASLVLAPLSRGKITAQSARCINNLKQLQAGYLMYVADNADNLPPDIARPIAIGDVESLPGSWVVGNAKRDPDATNIAAGLIFPDVGAAVVYRCPADRSKTTASNAVLRSRSYSRNCWLNSTYTGNGFDWTPETYPWQQTKISAITQPSAVFGFIDEHELSIETGIFIFAQPSSVPGSWSEENWYSLPADRHGQGCNLSFLDGHVEHWHWKAQKIYRYFGALPTAGADLEDHRRLAEAGPHDVIRRPTGWPF